MAALKYWVWLAALPGVGSRVKLRLLEHFSSPEEIYYAQPEDLPPVEGLSSSQAALLSDKSTDRAEDVLAHCAKGDMFLLTRTRMKIHRLRLFLWIPFSHRSER